MIIAACELAPTSVLDRSRFFPHLALVDDESPDSLPTSSPDKPASEHPVLEAVVPAEPDLLDGRARVLASWGRYRAARALHERALELRRRRFGEADPRLLQSLMWLGGLTLREGRLEESRWLYEQARLRACLRYGVDSPQMARILNNLAAVNRCLGEHATALEHCERALALKTAEPGGDPIGMSATLINLGHLCSDVRDARGAICCYARACSLLETSAAPSAAPLLAGALVGLGRVYMRLSATDAAITTLERALAIREAVRATPDRLVVVRLLLARALRGRDVHAAVTLATAAVREYELFGDGTGRTRSLGAWLIRFERSCCRAAGQR